MQGAWALSPRERTKLLECTPDKTLSISRQCELLGLGRSSVYYKPQRESDARLREILEDCYEEDPCMGRCRLPDYIERKCGLVVGEKRLMSLKKKMGLKTIYPHKDTSAPAAVAHERYPYLLKEMELTKADQVWTSDITYLPAGKGHFYLCCVMDWVSREILGYALSNTMDKPLVLDALHMAFSTGRSPEVFNTDQGSQYTSEAWLSELKSRGIRISMDGKGRWQDNVRMERFWRTYKYESYFLHGDITLSQIRARFERWVQYYNEKRPHSVSIRSAPLPHGGG